jgi:hypothetical protein
VTGRHIPKPDGGRPEAAVASWFTAGRAHMSRPDPRRRAATVSGSLSIRRVLFPQNLDESGSICAVMIKADRAGTANGALRAWQLGRLTGDRRYFDAAAMQILEVSFQDVRAGEQPLDARMDLGNGPAPPRSRRLAYSTAPLAALA